MKKRPSRLFVGLVALVIVVIGIGILSLMGPAVGNIYGSLDKSLAYPPTISVSSGALTATPLAQLLTVSDTRQNQPQQALPSTGESNTQPQTAQRIILRNATINITVNDPDAKIGDIMNMANAMGGWVVSSNTSNFINIAGEEAARGNVTVRVPADRLDEALEIIKSGTLSVDNENITGHDVTQDYVDISSRLENLKASERQLQAIIETAESVEDVLAVHTQLTNIRSEIEVLQGRINFYDESAAFSSITVGVQPPQPGPVEHQSAVWDPANTAESAVGRLVGVVQFLVDIGINLVIVVLPFIILLGIPTWVIRPRRQRRAV